jgi:uncharacterized membrane protein (DUF373 family)
MQMREEFAEARRRFNLLSFYDKFEYLVVLILTILIAAFIVFALWNLVLTIVHSVTSSNFNPDNYQVFQSIFGMMFTVIIALEFKRSILVSTQRMHSIVQVRTVILIGLLAVVRKLIILDVGEAGDTRAVCSRRRDRGAGHLLLARLRPRRHHACRAPRDEKRRQARGQSEARQGLGALDFGIPPKHTVMTGLVPAIHVFNVV